MSRAFPFGAGVLLIATVVATLILLLVPVDSIGLLRQMPALRGELQNLGHPVAFAALALLGRRVTRQWFGEARGSSHLMLAAGLAAFAGLTELLQEFSGRDASAGDFAGDLLGICAGLLWTPSNRRAMSVAAVALLVACTPLLWTVCAYLYRAHHSPVIWRADSPLLNRFARWQYGRYPGLVLEEVPRDWTGFGALVIDVGNADGVATTFAIRIHDVEHDDRLTDRFQRTFHLSSASMNRFEIPLHEVEAGPIGRQLDRAAVDGIVIFQQSGNATPGFSPREVRLAR